jgi:hypothetical protein
LLLLLLLLAWGLFLRCRSLRCCLLPLQPRCRLRRLALLLLLALLAQLCGSSCLSSRQKWRRRGCCRQQLLL